MKFEDFVKTAKAGDVVWICDYRFNDIDNKPIRHVRPTKVVVTSNDDLPRGKRVYYSDIHFRPFGKSGQPKAQVIAPYDNTGFRAYRGVALHVFSTEEECIAHYAAQCEGIIADFERSKVKRMCYYDSMIDEVRNDLKAVSAQ